VFVGFAAKATASSLLANQARVVPLDRMQRFFEFIAQFQFPVASGDQPQLEEGESGFGKAHRPTDSGFELTSHIGRK
jgi:hypothetical protein